ncbi:nucleotide exchange factor GrpE [Aureimonas sp. AU12]|uniref:nucleotide exchange factor GrpE n=1 Tax=Aureimonas sp. AU12 TaxID=1638161 RepID=UPI0007831B05|nr:nucleotide exchange factor GrpE [Aureimonas sp. AU12]
MTSETEKHAADHATESEAGHGGPTTGAGTEGAAYFKGGGAAGVTAGDRIPPRRGDDRFAAEDAATFGWNAPDPGAEDRARIAELEAENADVKDRMLRLAADMENLRRRTEREIKDARTFAVTNFARDMLAVSDNLDRTLQALPEGARDSGDAGFKALVEGVEITGRSMLATMERHGVKKLEPQGQRFDPNFHQAMFEIPNPDMPNNTVVQVVQDGYAIGERVLRPAMVGVSKGGPKATPAPAAGFEAVKPGVPDESSKDA